MDSAERSQLHQVLRGCCEAIAGSWCEAVAQTGFAPYSAAEVRQRFIELTEQVIALLLMEPFDRDQARSIGASLARLHYVTSEALRKTQQVLASQLVEGLPADQVVALQPRLVALLGELAAGFFEQAREVILAEQEQIRMALATALKQVEEALRESDARYRTVSELVSDFAFAFRVEPDGTLVREWVTGAVTRITGYDLDKIDARGGWKRWIYPDDMPIVLGHLQACLSGQPRVSDFRVVIKEDDVRWLRVHGHPKWDEAQGRVVRIIGAAQDITESKRREQYLLRTERLAAMGWLTAALAHEINNPLQTIRSNVEFMRHFALETGEREECLDIIYRELERLIEITRSVLDYSRFASDERYPVPIARLMQQALVLAGRQLEHAHVEVTTDLPVDLHPVLVTPAQIVQVLLNLIINATEAMPHGGHLHVAARVDGEVMVLALTNDGPPIPPEHIEHIFEPFFTTKPDGHGLGLFISHNIVQRHGGTISVDNLSGDRGVALTVTLPVARPAEWEEETAA